MWMAVVLTHLNVQLEDVEVRVEGSFIDIWIRVTQSQQVASIVMQ